MQQFFKYYNQLHTILGPVVATIVLLVAASIVIGVAHRLIGRWLAHLERRLGLPPETVLRATQAIKLSLWALTALIALDLWGVGLGGLWTLLVSAAAVIGVGFLATWTMVSNFTASFFLSMWRPFHLGQIVEILPENLKGRVIDRNLMFTALREDTGEMTHIPNNLFFQRIFKVIDGEATSPFEAIEARRHSKSNHAEPLRN